MRGYKILKSPVKTTQIPLFTLRSLRLALAATQRATLAVTLLLTTPVLIAAEADLRLPNAAMNRDLDTVRALIADGVDPNTMGILETPALHWLVRLEEVDTARLLLEAGAAADGLTGIGVTPLSLAVEEGSAEMTALLLEHGADANRTLTSGESLLMSAAAVGVAEVVDILLKHGADVSYLDEFGQSALMVAAREGHTDVVKLLLDHGAEVNLATKVGPAPDFIAPNSQRGFGFGIGIIRGGVPKDRGRREPQPGGMTPLLYAARHNHIGVAELLLDAGAELNAKEANGIWPLLIAISNNNMPMAHFLLQQDGVLIDDQDWYGRSPIWEAVNVRNLYVHNNTFVNGIDRGPVLELIKELVDKGADLNVRTRETPPFRHHLLNITGSLEWVDFTGQTPFLTAALAGDLAVMKLLLEHGADPKIDTFEGTSPLMAAAGVNWVLAQTWTEGEAQLLEAVKLCLELGMDVNQQNSMGVTALMGAANRGSDTIIQYLADNGADLTLLDKENRSALDWAKGVFLATHPAEPKPTSIELLTKLLTAQGKEVR